MGESALIDVTALTNTLTTATFAGVIQSLLPIVAVVSVLVRAVTSIKADSPILSLYKATSKGVMTLLMLIY